MFHWSSTFEERPQVMSVMDQSDDVHHASVTGAVQHAVRVHLQGLSACVSSDGCHQGRMGCNPTQCYFERSDEWSDMRWGFPGVPSNRRGNIGLR